MIGVDASEAFLSFARHSVRDPRTEFRSGDADNLPVEDRSFDVAVAGLVLNFVPEPGEALAQMRSAVAPGGIVSVYVWDYAGEMQVMRRFWSATATLDPVARELDEGRRFPICNPEMLRKLFADAGLVSIRDRAIRCADHISGLRRLLVAISWWSGPGAWLLRFTFRRHTPSLAGKAAC